MKLWCGLELNAIPIGSDWEYYCELNDMKTDPTVISNFCGKYLSETMPEVISVDADFFHVVDMLHNIGMAYQSQYNTKLTFKVHVHDGDALVRSLIAVSPYLEEVSMIVL